MLRVLDLEQPLLDHLVDVGEPVADPISKVGGLTVAKVESGFPLYLCPGRPVDVQSLADLLVVLLGEGLAFPAVGLPKGPAYTHVGKVFYLFAMGTAPLRLEEVLDGRRY